MCKLLLLSKITQAMAMLSIIMPVFVVAAVVTEKISNEREMRKMMMMTTTITIMRFCHSGSK